MAARPDMTILTQTRNCDFITGKIKAACIPEFIGHLVVVVFQAISVFFLINVMYAGYQLAVSHMSEGDKGAGKERIRWSIIGLIISVCSFLILELVLSAIL